MTSLAMPTSDVFAAFGVEAHVPARLSGGRGLTWRAGDIVLRPPNSSSSTPRLSTRSSRWKHRADRFVRVRQLRSS
ncbi:hypothetical protein [Paramicrobacterium agarici]|uniref:hypothetical protein n=1 Tax=Paramicrobacterium agarici TaxID=630514 RepID=UPI00114DEB52|nr:hypothetical protein [Microbacterium agarici]